MGGSGGSSNNNTSKQDKYREFKEYMQEEKKKSDELINTETRYDKLPVEKKDVQSRKDNNDELKKSTSDALFLKDKHNVHQNDVDREDGKEVSTFSEDNLTYS